MILVQMVKYFNKKYDHPWNNILLFYKRNKFLVNF